MARQTIVIDIDDVLSASAAGFSAYSNTRWGTKTSPNEYTEAWAEFWDVPLNQAIIMAEEFHASDAIYYYEHFEEAKPVLASLKDRYNLIVLTSRRASLKAYTDKWLEEHFPDTFDAVHYAGIWDEAGHPEHKLKQTKAELCRELGADYLIDDQPKHCSAAQAVGVQALLFGNYAWNRHEELTDGTIRVASWKEVKRFFDAKS
jgi:5'(3')-deoxyribonucleotidase